jgi:hypothetical protein
MSGRSSGFPTLGRAGPGAVAVALGLMIGACPSSSDELANLSATKVVVSLPERDIVITAEEAGHAIGRTLQYGG